MPSVRLCSADDIPNNSMRRFEVSGLEILIARCDGQFYALGERCTHRGGPLSEGTLERGIITCPWHFGEFEVKTGKVAGPPPSDALETYALEIKEGGLFVSTSNQPISSRINRSD